MKKDSLSDERLVLLHQDKRVNAFFIIYRRYKNYGYAVIYRTLEKYNLINALYDEKDAILYDSIMEAMACFNETRGTFRKLLSAIINYHTSRCVREFKKDPLSDYISLDAQCSEDGNLRFSDSLIVANQEASPQEIVNLSEKEKKVIINYSGGYKRRIKKMVRLKQEGFTFKEIAKEFNTTEKAVRSIFYRIKRRIELKDNNKIKK